MYFILVFFQRGLGPDADNDPLFHGKTAFNVLLSPKSGNFEAS